MKGLRARITALQDKGSYDSWGLARGLNPLSSSFARTIGEIKFLFTRPISAGRCAGSDDTAQVPGHGLLLAGASRLIDWANPPWGESHADAAVYETNLAVTQHEGPGTRPGHLTANKRS